MIVISQFISTLWQKSVSVQFASKRSILQKEIAHIDAELRQEQLAIIDNQTLNNQNSVNQFIPISVTTTIENQDSILANR